MSIELRKAAQDLLQALTLCRMDARLMHADDAQRLLLTGQALRAAIQQAEAQQPATPEPVQAERDQLRCAQADAVMPLIGPLLDAWENADREVISQEPELSRQLKAINNAMEGAQPATGEPMQADSSEHLRVIASLGAALRRLSFAAQTTGGTAGPDAELQSAIGQAEQALSLGGIWQAMSATGEQARDRCAQCKKAYSPGATSVGCPKCAPGVSVSEDEFKKPIVTGKPVAWMASYVDPIGNDRVYVTSHHDLAVENDMYGTPRPLVFGDTHPAPSEPTLIEKAISSGHFGVLPVKATIPMCKAGWGASGGELTFQEIGRIYEEMYKARPPLYDLS